MRPFLLLMTLLLVAAHPVPAAGAGVKVTGPGSDETSLSARPDVADFIGTIGSDISIPLDANPTTGYIWRLGEPLDEKVITLSGHHYERPETDQVGAGGRDIWRFKGVGAGQTRVILEYARPWEKGVAPIKEKIFKIRIVP